MSSRRIQTMHPFYYRTRRHGYVNHLLYRNVRLSKRGVCRVACTLTFDFCKTVRFTVCTSLFIITIPTCCWQISRYQENNPSKRDRKRLYRLRQTREYVYADSEHRMYGVCTDRQYKDVIFFNWLSPLRTSSCCVMTQHKLWLKRRTSLYSYGYNMTNVLFSYRTRSTVNVFKLLGMILKPEGRLFVSNNRGLKTFYCSK